ncbi:hypothetical protein Tco_0769622, partial [Tanacetum coccineum]
LLKQVSLILRMCTLSTERELVRIYIDDGNAFWNKIEVKTVYFLNGSHIRFALIKNPTIYVSLIEEFWPTATVRTVDNGEQEITAIVDGKEFTITEASVRRHLQLADVEGNSALSTTKFFDQLSLMRYVLTRDKLTFQKGKFSPQ